MSLGLVRPWGGSQALPD